MATYVSKHANLLVAVRHPRRVITATGESVETASRLVVQFQRGNAGDAATQQAINTLDFGALPQGVRIAFRTGVFDTENAQREYGWTDEDRKIVEDFLDRNQGNESGYIRVEEVKIEAPWPAIEKLRPQGRRTNELSAEKLIAAADTFGVELDLVAAYLKQNDWPAEVVSLVRDHVARQQTEQPAEELVEA